MRDPSPPRPGYVTTRQAAKLYGCSTKNISRVMPMEGVTPEVTPKANGRGKMHWWNPADVLRVRDVRGERMRREQKRFGMAAKHPATRQAMMQLARQCRVEQYRQKVLARVAARKGITVEELLARNATATKK